MAKVFSSISENDEFKEATAFGGRVTDAHGGTRAPVELGKGAPDTGTWAHLRGRLKQGFYFFNNLTAAIASHLDVHADSNHILVRRQSLEINSSGVLAKGLVGSKVVCWR